MKKTLLGLLLAAGLSAPLFAHQETPQAQKQDDDSSEVLELMQRMTRLEQEKIQLADRLKNSEGERDTLRDQIQTLAKDVFELKQILKGLREKLPVAAEAAGFPAESNQISHASEPFPRPDRLIKGTVMAISTEAKFVILDIGASSGVKEGYHFKIIRSGRLVAIVKVNKLLEAQYSKAEILTGYKIEDIEDYDAVESISALPDPVTPAKTESAPAVLPQKTPEVKTEIIPSRPDLMSYRIQGKLGDQYTVNIGRKNKIKKGDRLGVIRNQKVIAMLVIEDASEDSSTATVAEKMAPEEIQDGDVVSPGLAGDRASIPAKVSGVIKDFRRDGMSKKIEKVLINIGFEDGATRGQVYRVKCKGEIVGKVTVTEVYKPFSFAVPGSETRLDDLHIGDTVDLIQ